jgi:hypothetical protein
MHCPECHDKHPNPNVVRTGHRYQLISYQNGLWVQIGPQAESRAEMEVARDEALIVYPNVRAIILERYLCNLCGHRWTVKPVERRKITERDVQIWAALQENDLRIKPTVKALKPTIQTIQPETVRNVKAKMLRILAQSVDDDSGSND